jgi:Transposase Tn5 dimerisation domain
MSWSGNQAIEGLGPVGNGKTGLQGFHLHSVIALSWQLEAFQKEHLKRPPVAILGIVHQKFFVRKAKSKGAPKETNFKRKQRARESNRWAEAVNELGEAATDVRYVHVADREADIYEYLLACQRHSHGYVVRAAQNRALDNAETGFRKGYLFEKARAAREFGSFQLRLRGRKGAAARTASLKLSYDRVLLSAPLNAQACEPIRCNVLRVWEEQAPEGVEALEWILLTDAPVGVFEQALECVLQYATRWVIEEYHKALKTGLKAESLQLEQGHRLMAAIAIKSIVALRLIDLKERVRIDEANPAEESSLSDLELKVLRRTTGKPLKTVKDVALQIGRLGGHMNRKADGMPGWITLWRGMEKLKLLVEGVRIAHTLTKFG